MCRSRRELSNEHLLAKIGVDTAENEPLEVGGKFNSIFNRVLSRSESAAAREAAELAAITTGCLCLRGRGLCAHGRSFGEHGCGLGSHGPGLGLKVLQIIEHAARETDTARKILGKS